MNFYKMIDRILSHEGDYTANPLDRGNWTKAGVLKGTKFGISARTYPDMDIKNLTRKQAISIYNKDFYQPLEKLGLLAGTMFQLLDYAINSGIQHTIKSLQKIVGTTQDGIVGPVTAKAALNISNSDIVMYLLADRLEYMASLSSWKSFSNGWANRIAQNLRYGAEDT